MMATINLPAIDDSFVDSFQPTLNYGSSPVLLVGKLADGILYRSLLKFDLASIPSGASITSAQLTLEMNFDYSGAGTIASITPYAVADNWSGATVTWNNQPAINQAIAGTTANVTVTGPYSWNVLSLVNGWSTGSLANNGLELRTGESASLETKSFVSSNAAAQKPVLTIKYETDLPAAVTIVGHAVESGHEDVTTTDSFQYSVARDTSQMTEVSFTIHNTGGNTAIVGIQYSNDGLTYTPQEFFDASFPNTVILLPALVYSGFKRVAYRSLASGQPTTLAIDYQAQI
ncbi:DNRLRE domain-containing protein [Candidatus Formimonas warabiya]|nr:DNRLRE domain-containing protein [Candidatus Formimonas warabiya]